LEKNPEPSGELYLEREPGDSYGYPEGGQVLFLAEGRIWEQDKVSDLFKRAFETLQFQPAPDRRRAFGDPYAPDQSLRGEPGLSGIYPAL